MYVCMYHQTHHRRGGIVSCTGWRAASWPCLSSAGFVEPDRLSQRPCPPAPAPAVGRVQDPPGSLGDCVLPPPEPRRPSLFFLFFLFVVVDVGHGRDEHGQGRTRPDGADGPHETRKGGCPVGVETSMYLAGVTSGVFFLFVGVMRALCDARSRRAEGGQVLTVPQEVVLRMWCELPATLERGRDKQAGRGLCVGFSAEGA